MSAAAKVITLNTRNAQNGEAEFATMFETDG